MRLSSRLLFVRPEFFGPVGSAAGGVAVRVPAIRHSTAGHAPGSGIGCGAGLGRRGRLAEGLGVDDFAWLDVIRIFAIFEKRVK